ncbi:hypothetical protein [Corynebacterium macginleyi]|uniref:hypothetical protein n=1 Tax=Corynebacterium macginleyi TaxID=38290 RepID=UPI000EFA0E86|nr:hypothetical protein [Corynebacterium macginleyi]RMB65562.1 hypothetical protein D9542_09830 [Corynebacterium macginleyi]
MLTAKLRFIITEHRVLLNQSSEIGILKSDSEGAVRVDLGVVDEGVPRLVAVFEGWLGGEEVADFYGLSMAAMQIVDLVSDVLVLVLKLTMPGFELSLAVIIFIRIMGYCRCRRNELVHQHDGFFHPLPNSACWFSSSRVL